MLSFEEFDRVMTEISRSHKFLDKLSEVLWNTPEVYRFSLTDSVIKCLENIFNDSEEGLIYDWVWNSNCGKGEYELKGDNGQTRHIQTTKELYDVLLVNMGAYKNE